MKREAFFFLCLNIGFAEANPNRALKISETESPSRGKQANREDGAASGWGHSRACPELVEGLPLKLSPNFFVKSPPNPKFSSSFLLSFSSKTLDFSGAFIFNGFGPPNLTARLFSTIRTRLVLKL